VAYTTRESGEIGMPAFYNHGCDPGHGSYHQFGMKVVVENANLRQEFGRLPTTNKKDIISTVIKVS